LDKFLKHFLNITKIPPAPFSKGGGRLYQLSLKYGVTKGRDA
jgi:hypothetical protein